MGTVSPLRKPTAPTVAELQSHIEWLSMAVEDLMEDYADLHGRFQKVMKEHLEMRRITGFPVDGQG